MRLGLGAAKPELWELGKVGLALGESQLGPTGSHTISRVLSILIPGPKE